MSELIFGCIIIAATIAYFYRRKKKLKHMALEAQLEDMLR